MQRFLSDYQQGHSNFQLDHFVVGKSGTNVFGWYKQVLWELVSRWQTLRLAYLDIEATEAEIEELEACGPTRKNQIEVKKKRVSIEHSLLGLRDTEREFAHFYQHALQLRAEYEKLTAEELIEQEQEHWINHSRTLAALDMLATGRPSQSTWRLICSLPKEMRERIDFDGCEKWLLEQEVRSQPQFPSLPHVEVRRLVQELPTCPLLGHEVEAE